MKENGMEYYRQFIGKDIKVIANRYNGHKPGNPYKILKPGDIIKPCDIVDDGEVLLFKYFITEGIRHSIHVEDCQLEDIKECNCPTLIFGHHHGCSFYKEL